MADPDSPLPLHEFLSGEGHDDAGRTVADVLAFSRREIEMVHDFVQWLFPNRAPSRFNPDAPVLTDAEVAAIRGDPLALANLRTGIAMMMRFYAATDGWRRPLDHNQLRITRILTAARELISVEEARRLLAEIEGRADAPGSAISDRTRRFWRDAAG